jgi:aspartate ammonia-lyase
MKTSQKKKVNKVIKGLNKASKSHAAQARTLKTIFKKGRTKK